MANLMRASQELFRRSPDERFHSLDALWEHCRELKRGSMDRWHAPASVSIKPITDTLQIDAGTDGAFLLNDWSFGQLARMAGVAKDTVNRLSPDTATRVLQETLPRGTNKPLQILTKDSLVRSIHGTQYTRLWDADLVAMLKEFAVDFQPPQEGCNGATGLYAGEQDMFCFMIDPAGWAEIDGQAFAPGFFVWNSEVGRRSLGVQTFWWQAVCANHIVWDATEVVEWTRKHTAKVADGLPEIRRIIDALVRKRDERKDSFVRVIKKAMGESLGDDADKVIGLLTKQGITRSAARRATEIAREQGRFTIFALVDALTRLSQEGNAGERIELDQQASSLLELVA